MQFLRFIAVLAVVVTLDFTLASGVERSSRWFSTPPDFGRCEDGDDNINPPDCPAEDESGLPAYFPYPYDCKKYFECTNGVARCILCPVGTVWDQDLLTCNHEDISPCRIITTPQPTSKPTLPPSTTTPEQTSPSTTTTEQTSPSTTTPEQTSPSTTTPEQTSSSTVAPETTTTEDPANYVCPEGYVGRMAHPHNCRQFYNCDPARRPCLFDCPADLYFNPASKNCDWPENVPSCQGGTPSPPTINYRNIKRFRTMEKSWFSGNSNSPSNPCEEPSLKYEYY